MKLLTSVRNLEEAQQVVAGGSDWLDLKEPRSGALGAVSIDTLKAVVDWARCNAPGLPLSATIGDERTTPATMLASVTEVAATGVNYVKLGLFADSLSKIMSDTLAEVLASHHNVIVICFVEKLLDLAVVEEIIGWGAAGMMLDTAEKRSGSLTAHLSMAEISDFVSLVRRANVLCGLAGKLTLRDIDKLSSCRADYLGFRSAICKQAKRNSDVCSFEVRKLRQAMTSVSSQSDIERDAELMLE